MHVLQLANFYGPRTGGLRVAVDRFAEHYVGCGHQVTLVIPGDRDEVDRVGARTVVKIRSPFVPGLGGYRAIVDRRAVREAIDDARPDVVELSDKTTLVSAATHARRRGVPVALFSHERMDGVVGEVVPGRRLVDRTTAWINGRLAERVDAVVCASDYAADEFTGCDVPVRRVPLGVDLETFRPDIAPGTTVRAPGSPLRIVTVVRLSPEKRPELLITTSAALRRRGVAHEWIVLGDGPMREQLERQAARLPLDFRGHVGDRRELAAAVAAADVGIAPGLHETFGLAALEVLACGTPLVVPDHGALPELIDAGAGLVSRRTGDAFAAAACRIAATDRDVNRSRARACAERFTWERSGSEMLAVLTALVDGGVAATGRTPRTLRRAA